MKKDHYKKGFTMIELLIVISLVGILSSILVSTINAGRQRDYANDGVRRQNLMDLVQTVETYFAAERSYPNEGGVHNPLDASATPTDTIAAFYIEEWPSEYIYNRDTAAGDNFSIHVQMGSSTDFFKYSSAWPEKHIKDCSPTDIGIVASCDEL
ncbi:type IV pilin protein [Patescibacteria group bacterium]